MKFSKHDHFSDLDLKDSPDPGPHWATQADRSHGEKFARCQLPALPALPNPNAKWFLPRSTTDLSNLRCRGHFVWFQAKRSFFLVRSLERHIMENVTYTLHITVQSLALQAAE